MCVVYWCCCLCDFIVVVIGVGWCWIDVGNVGLFGWLVDFGGWYLGDS